VKTYGTVPAYEDYSSVQYPISADEDLALVRTTALATPRYRKPRGTTDRSIANIDKWRAENPDELRTWTTTYGCVVAFWGMRIYYGTCQSCGCLVTARRPMAYHGTTGRWSKNCRDCRARKAEDHDDKARHRMRRARHKYANQGRRDDGFEYGSRFRDWLSVDRKRLGIDCLDCGEPIRIVALTRRSEQV
jgi:hypothetical protein